MESAAIFALIEKGLALLPTLIDAGINIADRIDRLRKLAKGGQEGTVTQEQLEEFENTLDADIIEFLKPLPPD